MVEHYVKKDSESPFGFSRKECHDQLAKRAGARGGGQVSFICHLVTDVNKPVTKSCFLPLSGALLSRF